MDPTVAFTAGTGDQPDEPSARQGRGEGLAHAAGPRADGPAHGYSNLFFGYSFLNALGAPVNVFPSNTVVNARSA